MSKLKVAVFAALLITPLLGATASAANFGGVPFTRPPMVGAPGGGGGGVGVRPGGRGGGGGGFVRGGNRGGGFVRGRGNRGGGYYAGGPRRSGYYRRGPYFGSSIFIGSAFGPWYDPFWYGYGYPYRYWGYYDYPPPRVVVREVAPPLEDFIDPDAPPPPQYWYYCRDPEGYYPYVRQCNGPWEEVPASPPGASGGTDQDPG